VQLLRSRTIEAAAELQQRLPIDPDIQSEMEVDDGMPVVVVEPGQQLTRQLVTGTTARGSSLLTSATCCAAKNFWRC